ncbi:hypothetical protein L6164_012412 [Bauhinia variegata]|uniref:Uncharacterized protein n=1 Tax=Bauhinia variegata TaxID=167791 RepID=A0ACB9PF66_BAUVA|nr:hypothetical protein L6164_012412 [Bauhinia variegata]
MKWSELESSSSSGCKEHPNNKQAPGVCSSCLREKLAQLYVVNLEMDQSFDFDDPSSLSLQPQPQTQPKPVISAPSYRRRYRRNASDGMASAVSRSSMLSFNQCHGFNKSRSVVRDRNFSGRKKKGFWSKLLIFTGKETAAITREQRA